MADKKWCMCKTVTGVARDMDSTCMQCGGKDAYKKSKDRPIVEPMEKDMEEKLKLLNVWECTQPCMGDKSACVIGLVHQQTPNKCMTNGEPVEWNLISERCARTTEKVCPVKIVEVEQDPIRAEYDEKYGKSTIPDNKAELLRECKVLLKMTMWKLSPRQGGLGSKINALLSRLDKEGV